MKNSNFPPRISTELNGSALELCVWVKSMAKPVRPKLCNLPRRPIRPFVKLVLITPKNKTSATIFIKFQFLRQFSIDWSDSCIADSTVNSFKVNLLSNNRSIFVKNGSWHHERSRTRDGSRWDENEAAVHTSRHLRHLPGRAGISSGQASSFAQRGGLPSGNYNATGDLTMTGVLGNVVLRS